jgi:putative oxidoreductase
MNQITPAPANHDRPRSSLPGAGAGREVTGRRRPLLTAATSRMNAGGRSLWPVAVRCVAAIVFLIFGVSKFVNHAAELASFRHYPLPAPGTLVYAVGVIEISGGLLLALGLLTRLTALTLAADMLGAIVVSGLARWELVSLTLAPILLAAMIILIRFGAGDWSLDRHLAANMSRRRAAFLLIFSECPSLETRRFTCQLVHPVTGEGMSAEEVHRPGDHERYGRNRYPPTAASSSSSPSESAG